MYNVYRYVASQINLNLIIRDTISVTPIRERLHRPCQTELEHLLIFSDRLEPLIIDMATKRSWTSFQQEGNRSYVSLGTDVAEDGTQFAPIWKQEARDEQGRRRFHGAFTGGWSAG